MAKKSGAADKRRERPAEGKRGAQRPRKAGERFSWPFGRRNLVALLAGIAVIVIGYVFLGWGPHDSFVSLNIAPVLLIFGYMVLIPLAILLPAEKKRKTEDR